MSDVRKKFKPKIITLCGSTKFKEQFNATNLRLTLDGNIVLSCSWFGHADKNTWFPDDTEKILLDRMHWYKIDISDSILVINWEGYIGESTSNEIEYANRKGKPVEYLSERADLLQFIDKLHNEPNN